MAAFIKGGFRPARWSTAAMIVAVLVCGGLSRWQFERAAQKAALEDAAQAALSAAPVELRGDVSVRPFLRASATGHYLSRETILIDNRVRDKIVGMHIITPLLLQDGTAIAVNRGFIARGAVLPPPPEGIVTVRGVLQKDNADAFVLSEQLVRDNVWQNLNLQKYAAATNLSLLPLALYAEDVAAPATIRADYKSARSIGYALQWATFAALAIIFYIIMGFRK